MAQACGLPAKVQAEVRLILDELTVNIANHGYVSQDGPIQLRALQMDHLLVIWLSDRAPAFNPLAAAEPDVDLPVEERMLGGLGIHFVRQLADGLRYRRLTMAGGTNQLRILKCY